MSENTLHITDAAFDAEVLGSDQPVLVDFWAEWCGPCKMIGPFIDEIANEYAGQVKVAKVDVDANPMVPGRYMVTGIPTLMIVKDGQVVDRWAGFQPKDAIIARLLPHINTAETAA